MKIREKEFKNRSCCGCHTLYQLNGWDKDDWMCGDDLLRELINNNYEIKIEKGNY